MIIDTTALTADPLASGAGDAALELPPLPPMPDDVNRFQSAVSSYRVDDSAAAENKAGGVLASIDSFASEATNKWKAVLQAFDTESMLEQPAEMLKAQMYMVETSVTFDLLGKVAGKATQNLDQLLHVQ